MLIFIVVLCGGLNAALPPLAQSIREIEAIIKDPQLYQLLDSAESIRDIKRTDGGYLVITAHQSLEVTITYLPSDRPGPAKFALQFSSPESR